MKRIIIGLLLIGVFIVGVGETSAQCTCARTYPTAFDELKDAEVVFIGEVISKYIVERPVARQDVYDMEIKFKVKKVWRNNLQELVTIRFLVYGCIMPFDKGTEYLVYSFKDSLGRLRTHCCCSRTKPLSKAAEDLKEFEERGEEPKQVEIIFLLADSDAEKKTLRYSVLENSTLPHTADRVRKLRIIKRSYANKRRQVMVSASLKGTKSIAGGNAPGKTR